MLTQENVTVIGMRNHPVNKCDLTAKAPQTDCAQTYSTGEQFAKELNYKNTHNGVDEVQINQAVDQEASIKEDSLNQEEMKSRLELLTNE